MYKRLNTEEVAAVKTAIVAAAALEDKLPLIARRLKGMGKGSQVGLLKGAQKQMMNAAWAVIRESPDVDQQEYIMRRVERLQLQFGAVRKSPEDMVIISTADAQTLFAPVLEKCDLDCPCVKLDKNGEEVPDIVAIKQCETRKALVRAGVSQVGLGTCPYSMLIGRKE